MGSDLPDDWARAVDDVVGFSCSRFDRTGAVDGSFEPTAAEVRVAVEEVLQSAREIFDRLGHSCSGTTCRCRAETLVQVRAYFEAKILGIDSISAQMFAADRFNQYLDERN